VFFRRYAMLRLMLVAVALGVLCSVALGDTIHLTNGRKLHGKVEKENDKEVVISIGKKQTITVKRDQVKWIEYNTRTGPDVAPPSTSDNWPPKPEGKATEPPKAEEKGEEKKAAGPATKEEEKPLDPELKKKIETLIYQLGHREVGFRASARTELSGIGEPAVPMLIDALQGGRNSWTKQGAAQVLGTIGDKRATEPLVKQLRNDDKWVRKESAEALRKVTGQNFGYDPEAEPAAREDATRKWEDWWKKQKEEEEKKKAEELNKQEETKKPEPEKPGTKPEEKKEPESPRE
jgi:hypothetical protein